LFFNLIFIFICYICCQLLIEFFFVLTIKRGVFLDIVHMTLWKWHWVHISTLFHSHKVPYDGIECHMDHVRMIQCPYGLCAIWTGSIWHNPTKREATWLHDIRKHSWNCFFKKSLNIIKKEYKKVFNWIRLQKIQETFVTHNTSQVRKNIYYDRLVCFLNL
jgi:hypothetical protein